MDPHGDQRLDTFLDDLASARIGPAGGAAAAISGALGAATVAFVCERTGQKETLSTDRQTCLDRRDTLLALASRDTAALGAAFGDGPPSSLDDRTRHVPVAIAEACASVLTTAVGVVSAVSSPIRSDLLTGGHLAFGGLRSALQIGWTNLETNESDSPAVRERLLTAREDGQKAHRSLATAIETPADRSDPNRK